MSGSPRHSIAVAMCVECERCLMVSDGDMFEQIAPPNEDVARWAEEVGITSVEAVVCPECLPWVLEVEARAAARLVPEWLSQA